SEVHPAEPPAMPRGTVPSVAGLGIREALAVMESAGYEVTFSGHGFVRSQTPAAGTVAQKGTKVTLQLGV
ncbi:MAG: PASTA domain-containing protein, partial [Muribaculaceae bacterium]|nr:PASTA domain-containing protein [Muribaculaceae bacterium]